MPAGDGAENECELAAGCKDRGRKGTVRIDGLATLAATAARDWPAALHRDYDVCEKDPFILRPGRLTPAESLFTPCPRI
jgi:hypothetical protein